MKLALANIVGIASLTFASACLACFCETPTWEEAIESSDIIFVGVVTRLGSWYPREDGGIVISEIFRGDPGAPPEVEVKLDRSNQCLRFSCDIGERCLVLGRRYQGKIGPYQCFGTIAVDKPHHGWPHHAGTETVLGIWGEPMLDYLRDLSTSASQEGDSNSGRQLER